MEHRPKRSCTTKEKDFYRRLHEGEPVKYSDQSIQHLSITDHDSLPEGVFEVERLIDKRKRKVGSVQFCYNQTRVA